jgi:dihydroorotase
VVHILQSGPLTKNEDTEEIPDYVGLKKAGAFALSNDGKGVQNAQTMYLAMKKAKKLGLPVVAHAQDDSLFADGAVNTGAAKKYGLHPISELSETTQIARDLLIAQETGIHYHVCHISTKTSVELIRLAKAKGINVTCEVTPHHLLLNETDVQPDNTNYKMNPPLRTKEDQDALIAGLLDGTIDIIATDHAPHTQKDKSDGLAKAAFGITGSETTFSELYTKFVKPDIFTLEQLLNWLSAKPAEIFSLKNAGELKKDGNADIAIFDLNHSSQIKDENYLSKALNSPFTNDMVYGQTVLTMVAGKIVYRREETK